MNSDRLENLKVKLELGLKSLEIDANEQQNTLFLAYLELLQKWNRHFNLTAVKTLEEMLVLHLFDSLSVLPYIKGPHLLDVGSGAGLPGIPLAICRPDLQVTLLDGNGKKTRFCLQAASELQLNNIKVTKSRVEEYRPERGFDTVISRAFAELKSMYTQSVHLRHSSGVMLAMKGRRPEEELEALRQLTTVEGVHQLLVPGLGEAERHLVCF